MIQVQAKRGGVEFIDELTAGLDEPRGRHSVHFRGMKAVEVHGVGVVASVSEHDPKSLAFRASQGWPWNTTVEGPGWERYARNNLDVLVVRDDLPFAQSSAVRKGGERAVVEIPQHVSRVEAVREVIHLANGARHCAGCRSQRMRSVRWRRIGRLLLRRRCKPWQPRRRQIGRLHAGSLGGKLWQNELSSSLIPLKQDFGLPKIILQNSWLSTAPLDCATATQGPCSGFVATITKTTLAAACTS